MLNNISLVINFTVNSLCKRENHKLFEFNLFQVELSPPIICRFRCYWLGVCHGLFHLARCQLLEERARGLSTTLIFCLWWSTQLHCGLGLLSIKAWDLQNHTHKNHLKFRHNNRFWWKLFCTNIIVRKKKVILKDCKWQVSFKF